jgi:CO dehydrogenase maturation factor
MNKRYFPDSFVIKPVINRLRRTDTMKMIISGKGGSGKSTLTALLARQYEQAGHRVLVVDTDESNSCLHRLLGTDATRDMMEYFGGKKDMMGKMRAVMSKPDGLQNFQLFEKPWTFEDLPRDFVAKKGDIRLAAIGKIHHAGEGCACPMGMLARQFLKNLKLNPTDVVITDTEAGIEHFGRGIEEGANLILMVLDPSYESVVLAKKAMEMAESIHVPLYYILSRTDADTGTRMRDAIADQSRIIGEIPQDPKLLAAGLAGQELPAGYPAILAITQNIAAHMKES